MRDLVSTNAFRKSFSLMRKRGKSESKMKEAIELLLNDLPLPASYKDHPLSGRFTGFRDIHIEPDWVLIYRKKDATAESPNGQLHLENTGTHSDLF